MTLEEFIKEELGLSTHKIASGDYQSFGASIAAKTYERFAVLDDQTARELADKLRDGHLHESWAIGFDCGVRVTVGDLRKLLVENQNLRHQCGGMQMDIDERSVGLAVWYGSMSESNGKANWTAILHRKGESLMDGSHVTIVRSEYPDRVRYEADRVRHIIGELAEEPDILAYDANLHSGYVKPAPERNKEVFVGICTPSNKDLTSFVYGVFKSDEEANEHFQKFGDKDCDYRVTREHMILEWDR